MTIESFGAFSETEHGEARAASVGKVFTAGDFAQWYGCEGAVVRSEAPCTDPRNWQRARRAKSRWSRWYFVGTRADGTRVKGEAVIRLLPERPDPPTERPRLTP